MAFSTKTALVLVLTLFVVSAVIMPSSVCHGIRTAGLGAFGGALDPNNRPVCIGRPCPVRGHPYGYGHGGGPGGYGSGGYGHGGGPGGYGSGGYGHGGGPGGEYYPSTPAAPLNGAENLRP